MVVYSVFLFNHPKLSRNTAYFPSEMQAASSNPGGIVLSNRGAVSGNGKSYHGSILGTSLQLGKQSTHTQKEKKDNDRIFSKTAARTLIHTYRIKQQT